MAPRRAMESPDPDTIYANDDWIRRELCTETVGIGLTPASFSRRPRQRDLSHDICERLSESSSFLPTLPHAPAHPFFLKQKRLVLSVVTLRQLIDHRARQRYRWSRVRSASG